jgi:hypothetical protein
MLLTDKKAKWTNEEVMVLKKNYNKSTADIKLLLPERTKSSISKMKNLLELTKKIKRWNKVDIQILKDNYPVIGSNLKIKGYSKSQILQKAYVLGLSKKQSKWTDEEMSALKINKDESLKDLKKILQERSNKSIYIAKHRIIRGRKPKKQVANSKEAQN